MAKAKRTLRFSCAKHRDRGRVAAWGTGDIFTNRLLAGPVLLKGDTQTKKGHGCWPCPFSIHARTDCVARRRNARFACSTS
jgi:hypothetical protein